MSGSGPPDPISWQANFDELNRRLFRLEFEFRGLSEELEYLRNRVRDVEAENRDLKYELGQHMVRLNKLDHTIVINNVIGNQQQSASSGPTASPIAMQLEAFKRRKYDASRGSIVTKAEEPSQGDVIEPCYSQDMNLGGQ